MCDVTRTLRAIEEGDSSAAERLLPLVYDELRRLAEQKMSQEAPGHTLQGTALVHEAYVRLVQDSSAEHQQWEGRGHFYAAAAEAMRRILVEAARRKARLKHGGGRQRQEFVEGDIVLVPPTVDLLALDEALEKLAREDATKAQLVQLRFFTGLSVEEAGKMLGISRATADRYWAYARAWLYDEISRSDENR